MIPGAAFFRLRNLFMRQNKAFQIEPVNKVRLRTGPLLPNVIYFWNFFFVQMCGEHYKKMKKAVDNNHALQALPGDFWRDDIGEIDVGTGDLSMHYVAIESN